MPRFDLFVILAEMRTGSNFLEANLNAVDGLACHGEAFNPHFVGHPGQDALLGVTEAARDADPAGLLAVMRARPGLNGFRLFGDHDPRVEGLVLADPRVAKVVLTRHPVESYVSREIAAATGQWRLTNATHAKAARARFDAVRFDAHLERQQARQLRVLRGLQVTGQTAFWIDYEDLRDLDVLNGLLAWLGAPARADALDRRLKKQNPEPLAAKVENFAEMEAALARVDRWDLGRTPSFEPRRAAAIPQAVAALGADLLHLPLRSGPEGVRDWLAGLTTPAARPRSSEAGLVEGFDHRSLRRWKAARPGHRSFAVLRHPLARAHAAFCERILAPGDGALPEVRRNLRRTFGLAVPEDGLPEGAPWSDAEHRAAFGRFLEFLRANLGGQTAVRVDPAWATQLALVQGMAGFVPPDHLLREEGLAADLEALAARLGAVGPPLAATTDPHAARLAAIHDAGLEAASRDAYARDHAAFGFGDWRPSA